MSSSLLEWVACCNANIFLFCPVPLNLSTRYIPVVLWYQKKYLLLSIRCLFFRMSSQTNGICSVATPLSPFLPYLLFVNSSWIYNVVAQTCHRIKFKVTVSTILSDFLNRNFSPKLEQMWVKLIWNRQKHRKAVFTKYFGENVFASNLCLGYSNSSQSR
jgi:hypothetical protein